MVEKGQSGNEAKAVWGRARRGVAALAASQRGSVDSAVKAAKLRTRSHYKGLTLGASLDAAKLRTRTRSHTKGPSVTLLRLSDNAMSEDADAILLLSLEQAGLPRQSKGKGRRADRSRSMASASGALAAGR